MAPPPAPPASKSKPNAKPSKEQAQTEIVSILRDGEQRRLRRSEHERQVHDAMLTAIFKAVHEDSVPESYLGKYSTDTKDRMGCDIAR